MKKLTARDLKDLNLLKHYRIIRKWACKNNGLNDADLELLIYFDCMDLFTKHDFEIGTYSYSWDNRRWNRLLKRRVDCRMETYETEQLKNIISIKFHLSASNL